MVRRVIEVVIDVDETLATDLDSCVDICNEVQSNLESVWAWDIDVVSVVIRPPAITVNIEQNRG